MDSIPPKRVGLARAPRLSVIWKASVIACIILLMGFGVSNLPRKRAFPPSPQALTPALEKYAAEKKRAGETLPKWIAARDLVKGGFLDTKFLSSYAPGELLVLTCAGEDKPQSILMVVKYPDGQDMCLMGDGSIQQVSAARKKQLGADYP